MALAEIVPNVLIGKHTDPGPEVSYVLDGELVLMIQGQPDKT
jgi:quercetin dioxygenase-like cupin family protein